MMDEVSFYAYSLSERERVLRFRGEIVPLPPKAVELLIALVHERGTVVSKERLMSALWGDAEIEEGNLNQAAFRLRRALERCDSRVRLETVPRRGYRLVIAAQEGGAESTPLRRSRPIQPWVRFATVLVAVVAAFGLTSSGSVRSDAVRRTIDLGFVTWSDAHTMGDINRSIAYFKNALQIAPSNAEAHAGMSYALISRALRDANAGAAVLDADAALDHAREAVNLDPSSSDAHAAWGQWHAQFGDQRIAERELKRAVELEPASTAARTWFGELLVAEGRPAEAAIQLQAALATNSTWTEPSDTLALLAYLRGAFGVAEAYARESLVLGPSDRAAKLFLAVSEAATRPRQAETDARSALQSVRGSGALSAHALLGYVYALEKQEPSAFPQLRDAQILASRAGTIEDPFTIVSFAGTYALVHRYDDAFAWLARLDRNSRRVFASDLRLQALRPDRRFAAWLRD